MAGMAFPINGMIHLINDQTQSAIAETIFPLSTGRNTQVRNEKVAQTRGLVEFASQ
jgi:hypothetical protein